MVSKKIDILTRGKGVLKEWQYECSTNGSHTCREAKKRFCIRYSLDKNQVKAVFSKAN